MIIRDDIKKSFDDFKKDIQKVLMNLSNINLADKINAKKYLLIQYSINVILDYVFKHIKSNKKLTHVEILDFENKWKINTSVLSGILKEEIKKFLGNNEMRFDDFMVQFSQKISNDNDFINSFYSNIDLETSEVEDVLITWGMVEKKLSSQMGQIRSIKSFLSKVIERLLPISYIQQILDSIMLYYRSYVHDNVLDNNMVRMFESYIGSLKRISDNLPVLKLKNDELLSKMSKTGNNVASIMLMLSNHKERINGISKLFLKGSKGEEDKNIPIIFYNYSKIDINSKELLDILLEYTDDYEKANEILLTVFGSAKIEKNLNVNVRSLENFNFENVVEMENKIEEIIELDKKYQINSREEVKKILDEFNKGALNLKNKIFNKVSYNFNIESKLKECENYLEKCVDNMDKALKISEDILRLIQENESLLNKYEIIEEDREVSTNEDFQGLFTNDYSMQFGYAFSSKNKNKINKTSELFEFTTKFYKISHKLYYDLKQLFSAMYINMFNKNIFYLANEFERALKNKIVDFFQGDFYVYYKMMFEIMKNEFESKFEEKKNAIIIQSLKNYFNISSTLDSLYDSSVSEFKNAVADIAKNSLKYSWGPIRVSENKKIKIDGREFFEIFLEQITQRESEIIAELNNIIGDKGKEIYDRVLEKINVSIDFTTYISFNISSELQDKDKFFAYLDNLVGYCNSFISEIKIFEDHYKKTNQPINKQNEFYIFGEYLNNIGVITVDPDINKKGNESLSDYLNRINIIKKGVESFKNNLLDFMRKAANIYPNIDQIFNSIDENTNLSSINNIVVTIKDEISDRFKKVVESNKIIKDIHDSFINNPDEIIPTEFNNKISNAIKDILEKGISGKVIKKEDVMMGKNIDIDENHVAISILLNNIYKIFSISIDKRGLLNFFKNGNISSINKEDFKAIKSEIYTGQSFEYIKKILDIPEVAYPKEEEIINILNLYRKFIMDNNLLNLIHMLAISKTSSFNYIRKTSSLKSVLPMMARELGKIIGESIVNIIKECFEQSLLIYIEKNKTEDYEAEEGIENNIPLNIDLQHSYVPAVKNDVLKKIAYFTPNYEWYKDYDMSSNRLNILNVNKEKFLIVSKEKFEPGEQVIIDNGVFQKEAIIAENIDNYKYKVYIDGLEDIVSILQIKKIRRQKNG